MSVELGGVSSPRGQYVQFTRGINKRFPVLTVSRSRPPMGQMRPVALLHPGLRVPPSNQERPKL